MLLLPLLLLTSSPIPPCPGGRIEFIVDAGPVIAAAEKEYGQPVPAELRELMVAGTIEALTLRGNERLFAQGLSPGLVTLRTDAIVEFVGFDGEAPIAPEVVLDALVQPGSMGMARVVLPGPTWTTTPPSPNATRVDKPYPTWGVPDDERAQALKALQARLGADQLLVWRRAGGGFVAVVVDGRTQVTQAHVLRTAVRKGGAVVTHLTPTGRQRLLALTQQPTRVALHVDNEFVDEIGNDAPVDLEFVEFTFSSTPERSPPVRAARFTRAAMLAIAPPTVRAICGLPVH